MGIIKKLLSMMEELTNRIKILEGKFARLRIDADLTKTKSKELPDSYTYKPQQPYLGKGLTLRLLKEGTRIADRKVTRYYFEYIPAEGRIKVLMVVKEEHHKIYVGGILTYEEKRIYADFGYFDYLYENGYYKIMIAYSAYRPEDTQNDPPSYPSSQTKMTVHYQIYELVYDFGDLEVF